MAKKGKVKKTLVDQILDKAKIDHDSLSFNDQGLLDFAFLSHCHISF